MPQYQTYVHNVPKAEAVLPVIILATTKTLLFAQQTTHAKRMPLLD